MKRALRRRKTLLQPVAVQVNIARFIQPLFQLEIDVAVIEAAELAIAGPLQTGGFQCQNTDCLAKFTDRGRITDEKVKGKGVISVLFLCTGNICRSPTAEGVFRHLVRDAGLEKEFTIASAGTEAYHVGDPPDARAVRTAEKYGVSIGAQRAQQLAARHYRDFDYIFAMDGGHYAILEKRAPEEATAKREMFLASGDVPDPWYGGEADFEHVYALVKQRCVELLNRIRKEHGL